MNRYNSDWTADRIKKARQMWAAGKSAAQTASALGKSRNAVIGKWDRLGLKEFKRAKHAKKCPIIFHTDIAA